MSKIELEFVCPVGHRTHHLVERGGGEYHESKGKRVFVAGKHKFQPLKVVCGAGFVSTIDGDFGEDDTCLEEAWVVYEDAPARMAQGMKPYIYFENADGKRLYPGDERESPILPGYERREVRNMREYEQFCREEDARANRARDVRRSREQMTEEAQREARGGPTRMQTNQGRALQERAREVGARRDREFYKGYSAGTHLEAMEYDSSNRNEGWDPGRGGRERK